MEGKLFFMHGTNDTNDSMNICITNYEILYNYVFNNEMEWRINSRLRKVQVIQMLSLLSQKIKKKKNTGVPRLLH